MSRLVSTIVHSGEVSLGASVVGTFVVLVVGFPVAAYAGPVMLAAWGATHLPWKKL